MQYHDMTIEASDATIERTPDKQRIGKFRVRVLASPAGEMKPEEATAITYDDKQLQLALQQLETRALDRAGLIALGRQLAGWLLPPKPEGAATGVRELFAASLAQIGPDDGLRLRLRLPPQLAALPWEYVYVDQAGGGDGMDGFLALDPRVAIVRHEALAAPDSLPLTTGTLKVVAALASAEGLPPLDLTKEQADLQHAFADQPGIAPTYLTDATLDEIQAAIAGAAIFHFAGHGVFNRQMGDLPGTYTGVGSIALYDQAVNAEQLGINLRGNGVRLAVLGGCETGRRDGVNVWSGIAPALIKQQIPAVIANQFPITDACAIAFSKQLYGALVGGLSIERAVAAGRIAAYNAAPDGRDWGVGVLYLRDADGILFGGAGDAQVRQAAAAQAHAVMNVHVDTLAAGGQISGVKGSVGKGSLESTITVGTATDAAIDGAKLTVTGGEVKTDINVGKTEGKTTIEAGEITL
jgi:hypothetical protein